MALEAQVELSLSLKHLLDSGTYSDLVITCGSKTFKVHKAIVCTRCGFFEGAERFQIASGVTESKIDLSEDEPAIVKLLLQFLYLGNYKTEPQNLNQEAASELETAFLHSCPEYGKCEHHSCNDDCRYNCYEFTCKLCFPASLYPEEVPAVIYPSDLLIHAKIYEIADKYDVPGLKALCTEKFWRASDAFQGHEMFAIAADYAFTTTPDGDRGLRKCVKRTLEWSPELIKEPYIKGFLKKHPDFMYEVLEKVLDKK